MSFQPEIITPEFSMRETRDCYAHLKDLKYPADRNKISSLSLQEMQIWYAAQDPHELIEADSEFHTFWHWNYIFPLKMKRFFYCFKFW